MAEKAQVNDLLIDNNSEQHTIDTEFGELSVWIKDLTWIERQEALSQFVGLKNDGDGNMIPQIDFGGFWKFVFTKCITKSEPSLTTKQRLHRKYRNCCHRLILSWRECRVELQALWHNP